MIPSSLQPREPWPPLILATNRPAWIVVRDFVLTLMAWGLLAWMLRDPIFVAYDYLRYPIFQLTTARPLDMKLLWLRLEIFFATSGGLIGLLFVSGVIGRHRLRAAIHFPQPPVLTDREQAEQFSVEESVLQAAHHYRIVKVHYAENGSISSLEPADLARDPDVVSPVG